MLPLAMMLMGAGRDPQTWGPILDALGPQFNPGTMIPGMESLMSNLGGQGDPFAPPSTSAVPPITPPPGSGVGVGGMPMTTPSTPSPSGFSVDSPLAMLLSPTAGVTPPPGSPLAPTATATPVTSGALPRIAPPSVVRPQAPHPVFSGGVTGAQKAPEIGAQMTTGGTPAQILLAALLGGQNRADPLRVPALGALLRGAY